MLTVNGLLVLSMRWLATWSGVWSADIVMKDVTVPTGKVLITSTDGLSFTGTVDSDRTGVFGEKQHVRVIGGGGGWGKPVRAQHYHSDVGVSLFQLASSTAAEAGEVVKVLAPVNMGVDFIRQNKTAAQIFLDTGTDWWVDTSGITNVGLRVPSPAPTTLQVNDWDPAAGTVSFISQDLVQPGAIIIDSRFANPKYVVEVDAHIRDAAIYGTLRLADSPPLPGKTTTSELLDSLAALATHDTSAEYSRFYEYRVIAMAGDRVNLQAIHQSAGMPDLIPISIWGGISGYRAVLKPSSRVLVGFTESKQPYVAAYEPPEGNGWRPVLLELDAITQVAIGNQAIGVLLGTALGALPVARAPGVITFGTAAGAANVASTAAIASALTAAAAAATAIGVVPVTGLTLAPILAAVATAVTAASTALQAANLAAVTALTTSCPSTKVIAS